MPCLDQLSSPNTKGLLHTCTLQLAQARMGPNTTYAGKHCVAVPVLVKSEALVDTWDSLAQGRCIRVGIGAERGSQGVGG